MTKTAQRSNIIISVILTAAVALTLFSGCVNLEEGQDEELPPFESYRDIPGLTEEDFNDIEKILSANASFSYAMMLSTEAFYRDGKIEGYSKVISEYLTDLFGVPFIPQIVTFEELLEGLRDGSLDFTGTLTPTPERREIYHMTEPIAQRTIKYFRLRNSPGIDEILEERKPVLAMLGRSASLQTIIDTSFFDFELILINEYTDAYDMLRDGTIDALLAESSAETAFMASGDVITEDYFPMINAFVSFTAYRDELAPIVNAVQKMLENNGAYYTGILYEKGHLEYLKYKIEMQLTDEERDYILNNPVIAFGAEFDNYPICFFDEHKNMWQGIAIDVIEQVCLLTGLGYEIINDENTSFSRLFEMLEDGSIYMISELIHSSDRDGSFLWPATPFISDRSVLMSRTEYHNVQLDRVYSEKIGVIEGTAHTEFFNTWFPAHPHKVSFSDHIEALEALKNKEIDLVMTSYSTSLYMSNYLEETVFRPAVIFDNSFDSTFGINKDHAELLSITQKVMELADISGITDHWLHKTYAYRLNLAEENNKLFRNMILVMLCLLVLVTALMIRSYYMSKRLEELVASRTRELAKSVDEISLARDEAQIANKSKSYFLANMSHEIRTPMNAISGITEIILLKDSLPDDVRDGLRKINNSCDMLMGIINDILDFSKIEAGKLDIVSKEYDVASVINDSAQLNMMRIGDKDIDFLLDVDENMPATLLGDELRIKQIMNNLLSNAFKYTEKGEVRLSVRATPGDAGGSEKADEETVNLVITVSDTGCGMTDDQLEHLFDEYTRFYQQVNVTVEGTGLGLAITHSLIAIMGGGIQVSSKVNEGSVFMVSLPQGKVNDDVLGKEITDNLKAFKLGIGRSSKGHSIVRDPMPYGHVLCVDDVETNLFVAIGLLKPYSLNIDTAMSGQEAIDIIKNGAVYDVIFMDHMMPDMDGVETVKEIRRLGYDEPIIALTANAVAGQSDMFIENGFDDFIAKPIDIRQLNTVLNEYIRDKQDPDVIEEARAGNLGNNVMESTERMKDTEIAKYPVSGSDDYDGDSEVDINGGKAPEIGISGRKINGMDLEKGLEKYSYDEDIYLKILKSYAANTRSIINTIINMGIIGEDNIEDYRLRVHSVKGTSLDMYADKAGNTAAELEGKAKAYDYDYINKHNESFISYATGILDELDRILADIDEANPKAVRDFPDTAHLKELSDACMMYSMDGVNKAMDKIEKYRYEADDGLAVWLRENVNIMAFNGITKRITEILKEREGDGKE